MIPSEKIIALCICRDPECSIPFGTCHCGCGNLTRIATHTDRRAFQEMGMPLRFYNNHRPSKKIIVNLIGRVFGSRMVISEDTENPDKKHGQYWIVKCACGNIRSVNTYALIGDHSSSCGCEAHRSLSKLNTTHGMWKSREYSCWLNMKGRCINPNNTNFARYGAKGVKVCPRWMDFSKFLQDMGSSPSRKHTIDRIKNNVGYQPGNCRWATMKEQLRNTSRNRRVEFMGRQMLLIEVAEITGVSKTWVYHHYRKPDFSERLKRMMHETT